MGSSPHGEIDVMSRRVEKLAFEHENESKYISILPKLSLEVTKDWCGGFSL